MNPKSNWNVGPWTAWATSLVGLAGALLVCGAAVASGSEAPSAELPQQLREALSLPVGGWIGKLAESKNTDGVSNKRGVASRRYRKVDDTTYVTTVHVNTAEDDKHVTQRYELNLKKTAKGSWEVAGEEVRDTYIGMYRTLGANCYPYDSFAFDREGMKMSSAKGSVCEVYEQGNVRQFFLRGDGMKYEYAPPAHASMVQTGHDFYAVHKLMKENHSAELVFEPYVFAFECDPNSCESLLDSSFKGLTRVVAAERAGSRATPPDWAEKYISRMAKERKENAFAHFQTPLVPENRFYRGAVMKDLEPLTYGGGSTLPGSGIAISVDNWESWEVQFYVFPRRIDLQETLSGSIYGYFSEETLKNSDAYALERRDDQQARWYEVYSVKGDVKFSDDDIEMLHGSIKFGLTLKQDLRVLPFFIATALRSTTEPPKFYINSVAMDDKELTWVKTGPISGLVVLPEQTTKGSKVVLDVDFDVRALIKRNHAFLEMNRFGWMPFVRFGDFIDEFEMTIESPAKYQVLGIGEKVDEKKVGENLITRWSAENPVVFPTIILGKYESAKSKFDAKKADGTVIPIEVHVDEVSMGALSLAITTMDQLEETAEAARSGALGIRGKQLQPIADQAANSINLYTEISGLDYPYGELNLVNDPVPALYGQAPSSVIYLGSAVFRGEGQIAGGGGVYGEGQGVGSTRTAKFLKSVVAHEVGHQWWGSRISNANQRNYWFVESLAEFFSAVYLQARYGDDEYQDQVNEWRGNILNTRMTSSVQNASSLFPGEDDFRSYQSAVYSKGPYAFHMLRESFGDEKFWPFLKRFSQELAAKREIVTLDIQHAAEKALGGVDEQGEYTVDLAWFFDQWIRGAGIPQYKFDYTVRKSEDGSYIIEGTIKQRIVIGSSQNLDVLEGQYFRGVIDITVKTKDENYERRVIVEGAETPFRLKVPVKPIDVALNEKGGILAHDVLVNENWN